MESDGKDILARCKNHQGMRVSRLTTEPTASCLLPPRWADAIMCHQDAGTHLYGEPSDNEMLMVEGWSDACFAGEKNLHRYKEKKWWAAKQTETIVENWTNADFLADSKAEGEWQLRSYGFADQAGAYGVTWAVFRRTGGIRATAATTATAATAATATTAPPAVKEITHNGITYELPTEFRIVSPIGESSLYLEKNGERLSGPWSATGMLLLIEKAWIEKLAADFADINWSVTTGPDPHPAAQKPMFIVEAPGLPKFQAAKMSTIYTMISSHFEPPSLVTEEQQALLHRTPTPRQRINTLAAINALPVEATTYSIRNKIYELPPGFSLAENPDIPVQTCLFEGDKLIEIATGLATEDFIESILITKAWQMQMQRQFPEQNWTVYSPAIAGDWEIKSGDGGFHALAYRVRGETVWKAYCKICDQLHTDKKPTLLTEEQQALLGHRPKIRARPRTPQQFTLASHRAPNANYRRASAAETNTETNTIAVPCVLQGKTHWLPPGFTLKETNDAIHSYPLPARYSDLLYYDRLLQRCVPGIESVLVAKAWQIHLNSQFPEFQWKVFTSGNRHQRWAITGLPTRVDAESISEAYQMVCEQLRPRPLLDADETVNWQHIARLPRHKQPTVTLSDINHATNWYRRASITEIGIARNPHPCAECKHTIQPGNICGRDSRDANRFICETCLELPAQNQTTLELLGD